MEYIFEWVTNTRYNRDFLKKTIEKMINQLKSASAAKSGLRNYVVLYSRTYGVTDIPLQNWGSARNYALITLLSPLLFVVP
jgi:hypothetical protein